MYSYHAASWSPRYDERDKNKSKNLPLEESELVHGHWMKQFTDDEEDGK